VTVDSGSFTVVVPARNAIAIHTGALGSGGGIISVAVTFEETATTTFGEVNKEYCILITFLLMQKPIPQNIFLVGSISQLGTWDPQSSVCPFIFYNCIAD